MGDLRCATWPELDHALRKLNTEELAELVLELQSIEGIHTAVSYMKRCDELFSQSVRDTRAAALTEAARKAVKKLSGMRCSVTVTGSQIAIGPILTEFSNLGVGIDVSICKRGIKNSVSEGPLRANNRTPSRDARSSTLSETSMMLISPWDQTMTNMMGSQKKRAAPIKLAHTCPQSEPSKAPTTTAPASVPKPSRDDNQCQV